MFQAKKDLFAGTLLVGIINILDPINGIFGKKNTCNVRFSYWGIYFLDPLDPVRREMKIAWIKNCLLQSCLPQTLKFIL